MEMVLIWDMGGGRSRSARSDVVELLGRQEEEEEKEEVVGGWLAGCGWLDCGD